MEHRFQIQQYDITCLLLEGIVGTSGMAEGMTYEQLQVSCIFTYIYSFITLNAHNSLKFFSIVDSN